MPVNLSPKCIWAYVGRLPCVALVSMECGRTNDSSDPLGLLSLGSSQVGYLPMFGPLTGRNVSVSAKL